MWVLIRGGGHLRDVHIIEMRGKSRFHIILANEITLDRNKSPWHTVEEQDTGKRICDDEQKQ